MAKVPKSVTRTSGQGVSRKSYQTGRNLGMNGTGSPAGGVKAMTVSNPSQPTSGRSSAAVSASFGSGRDYPKPTALPPGPYSAREFPNPTLGDLKAMPANKNKPAKGFVF